MIKGLLELRDNGYKIIGSSHVTDYHNRKRKFIERFIDFPKNLFRKSISEYSPMGFLLVSSKEVVVSLKTYSDLMRVDK